MDEITGKRPSSQENLLNGSLDRTENPPSSLHKKIPKVEEEKPPVSLVGRVSASAAAIQEIPQTNFSKVEITVKEGDSLDAIFNKKNYSFDLRIQQKIFNLKTDREEPTNPIIYELPIPFSNQKVSLRIQGSKNKEELDKLIKEGSYLLLMKESSYVLGALDVGVVENIVVFFSKTLSGFSLLDFLQKKTITYSLSQKLTILLDVAKGLKELHDKKLIHRNLYIENVFTNYRAKGLISDLSSCISTEEEIRDCDGYIHFKAPEVLNCHPSIEQIPTEEFLKQPHTTAVDIYSFGMLIYVFLTEKMILPVMTLRGNLFLPSINERLTKNVKIPELTLSPSLKINKSLQDLIEHCLRLDPKERPIIDDAIKELETIFTESKTIPPSSPPTFAEISITQGSLNRTSFIIPDHRFSVAINGRTFDLEGLGLSKEGKIIGSGSFGRIFVNEQKTIAIKAIIPRENSEIKKIEQEASILLQLKDAKHALGAICVGFEGTTLFCCMDYIKGTTLKEKIENPGSLTLGQKTEILLGVVLGLQEVHAIGFVHRDIKPDNIIIDEQYKARLIDFGLSSKVTLVNNKTGSLAYTAPEVLISFLEEPIKKSKIQIDPCIKQEKGFPIDIYSFGLVAHEILSHEKINKTPRARLTENLTLPKDSYEEYPISPAKRNLFIELVEGCLKLNPQERLPIPAIISKIEQIKSLD